MVYYLQHKGTQTVFFEEKENFLNTLNKALEHAEAEAKDGFDLDIRVGVTADIAEFNDSRRGCNSEEEGRNWNKITGQTS